MTDAEAWLKYPRHRRWYDKLELAQRFGYDCGPAGVAPTESGYYCVRPIMNLAGMGVGARRQWIEAGDIRSVEPGYFWCEWFTGQHLSVDYRWTRKWNGSWEPISVWEGHNTPDNLSRFEKWVRQPLKTAPKFQKLWDLCDVETLNVEFIGKNVIEIHLRPSPDPQSASEIIPVWADDPVQDYEPNFEDADGHLAIPRLGFVLKSEQ